MSKKIEIEMDDYLNLWVLDNVEQMQKPQNKPQLERRLDIKKAEQTKLQNQHEHSAKENNCKLILISVAKSITQSDWC